MDGNIRLREIKTLTKEYVGALETLVLKCNKLDQTELRYHKNDPKTASNNVMLYDHDEMIGYFCLSKSYTSGEYLMWGTIHPDYRNDTNFQKMIECIKNSSHTADLKSIRIINDITAKDMKEVYNNYGAKYLETSYEMSYDFDNTNTKALCDELKIRQADMSDLSDMTNIGMEAFDTSESDEKAYNVGNLENDQILIYMGFLGTLPIGMVSVKKTDRHCSIADLAVRKDHRGKGYGRLILSSTIKSILSNDVDHIRLGVSASNDNALKLYKDSGFKIDQSIECLQLTI